MGPVCHTGITFALLAGAKLSGMSLSPEIVTASLVGGVLLDSDKVFEIYNRKVKNQAPDITARDRILHSAFAFPFGALLGYAAHSLLPFIAVILHIVADSFILGLRKGSQHYPPHSPWK